MGTKCGGECPGLPQLFGDDRIGVCIEVHTPRRSQACVHLEDLVLQVSVTNLGLSYVRHFPSYRQEAYGPA